MRNKKPFRVLARLLRRLLALVLLVIAAYVAYLFMTYHRLPDTSEQHSSRTANIVSGDETYTALTWNLGFGAYSRDFSFFMDGGAESRARSIQAVYDNLVHCVDLARDQKADFVLFQEIDRNADRSWHVDEAEVIRETLGDFQSYYAQNCNTPYLLYPFRLPYGAAKSGLLTFADRDIYRSERWRLPVETDWRKLLDLDRCYAICRIPTRDDRELCLFNLHLSPRAADGAIARQQLSQLLDHLRREREMGNYVVAGGDFNGDLHGRSGEIFGVETGELSWAQPVDFGLFPEGLARVDALDADHPVPTRRACDAGYVPGQTRVAVTDGFIVSDNVEVLSCRVIDDDFRCSDHNPVVIQFKLIEGDAPAPEDGGGDAPETEAVTDELGS